jgi:hypothetical protein
MDNVSILPRESFGKNFVPAEYLPKGENEYYLRNRQFSRPPGEFRRLNSDEIDRLTENKNSADCWDDVLVTDEFDPALIHDTEFHGLVRIGALRKGLLRHHDLRLPAGITKSRIVSCDIGDEVAIHRVDYLSHCIIGRRTILANINELYTTPKAKFGNGIIKQGETEDERAWMEVMNENGARRVAAFTGMIAADACLWARYRDDVPLQKRLVVITQAAFDNSQGYYGTVGEQCVIKNSRVLRDVVVGDRACIDGADSIQNVTIESSADDPTLIGEGTALVNGIVGRGCRVLSGCKAAFFVAADHSTLGFGARLLHSFLGENSTVSGCEVQHDLIFPAHEQHHSNSFLIASEVMGQSNLAAGAVIGSNHNSRSNDNELRAGRGFWPGLCTSVKHPCRFASFTLLSKADYPAEMDIPLPFSLLSNNTALDRMEVIPAWWWRHNMYALARNSRKFYDRDKRKIERQHIEFEALAPDTVEEIIGALDRIELWTGKAMARAAGKGRPVVQTDRELRAMGKAALTGDPAAVAGLEVLGENMEKSNRKTVILKPADGYGAYRDMLHWYAVKNLAAFIDEDKSRSFAALGELLSDKRVDEWTNLGGQLIPTRDIDVLRADIGSGKLDSWENIHARYDELWARYPFEKQRHAYGVLCFLHGADSIDLGQWNTALEKAVRIQEYVCDQVYRTRKKDDDNAFRKATFRNENEMKAVVGTVDENLFIHRVREETKAFAAKMDALRKRG